VRRSAAGLDARGGGCEIGEDAKEHVAVRGGGFVRLVLLDIEGVKVGVVVGCVGREDFS